MQISPLRPCYTDCIDLPGLTHNFVSAIVAAEAGLEYQPRSGLHVMVVNGDHILCPGVARHAQFSVDDTAFSAHLFILPLGGYDMVLRTQWLATLGTDLVGLPPLDDGVLALASPCGVCRTTQPAEIHVTARISSNFGWLISMTYLKNHRNFRRYAPGHIASTSCWAHHLLLYDLTITWLIRNTSWSANVGPWSRRA